MSVSWSLVADGLQSPYGLAFDDDDVLFVSEVDAGRISRIVDGRVRPFAHTGGRPRGIAFDDSGDLFVAESARHHLLLISPDEAVEIYAHQCRGQRFASPRELCLAPQGDILFNDGGRDEADGSVLRADLDGEVKRIATGLAAPSGMVWSQEAGTLYVSESGAHRIVTLELDDDGDQLVNQQVWATLDLGEPGALLFDTQGCLFVAVAGVGIVVLDENAAIVETLTVGDRHPGGMTFGGLEYDQLFVTDLAAGSIFSCQRDTSGQRPFAGPRSV